jgi:hypothetical protein
MATRFTHCFGSVHGLRGELVAPAMSDIRIELDLAREARDLEILPKRAQRDLSKAVT